MNEFYGRLFEPGWYLSPFHWIAAAWLAWVISWMLAAVWSRQTSYRASFADEAPYRLVTIAGALLLFGVFDQRLNALFHIRTLWSADVDFAWAMFALVVLGFAFAWWARIHLGTLWSGTVTRKEDHRIVDTGPYGLVRHPIYTGLILSALATALVRGEVFALVGVALFALGCWMKARVEERILAEGLGVEAYANYRARVPMLVPFVGS